MKRLTSFIHNNLTANIHTRAFLMRAVLLLSVLMPFEIKSAYSNHNTSIVETLNVKWHVSVYYPFTNLNGEGTAGPLPSKIYYSGNLVSVSADEPNYINATIKDGGLSWDDEDDIVVYLRRTEKVSGTSSINNAQPTALGVQVWFNFGENDLRYSKDYIFNLYFLYRGPSTEEYSSRIPIKNLWKNLPEEYKDKKVIYLRFFTLETNNDYIYSGRTNKLRETALNSFDVLKIPHDAAYSDTWADRFHLKTDYQRVVEDFSFNHTRGILDKPNMAVGWDEITDADKNTLNSKNIDITFPDFNLINSTSSEYPLDPGQERQPTHTVEHTIYAMPGDVIPLYPYYGLTESDGFQENFSHWYAYKTGERLKYNTPWKQQYDLLDFLTDPTEIQITKDNGFYAGSGMNGSVSKEYKIATVDEYIAAVNEIKEKKYYDAYIELDADLDFNSRPDIPMLGDGYSFIGIIHGNGHTLSNLKYNFPNKTGVGLIGQTSDGVTIENLILDQTCSFIGLRSVGGIAGIHEIGKIRISNIKTEALVYGVNGGDQNAGGLLGKAYKDDNERTLTFMIKDCYIGGQVGNNTGTHYNGAIIGEWMGSAIRPSSLKNIMVECTLIGAETPENLHKMYIRHQKSDTEIITDKYGVKTRGDISYENCYGNIQPSDLCWNPIEYSYQIPDEGKTKLSAAGWDVTTMTPPTSTTTGISYEEVGSVVKYIEIVKKINNGTLAGNTNIKLTANLDFSTATEEVPMIGNRDSWRAYTGHFNGDGHIISGLKIKKPNSENVGMFEYASENVVIENLILDSSCEFIGQSYVGLIGRFYGGKITVNNVRTEATVRGTTNSYIGACAAGIIGMCGYDDNDNHLHLKNIYIGGTIGSAGTYNNGAITGFFSTSGSTTTSEFENIVITCTLNTTHTLNGNKYILNQINGEIIEQSDGVFVKAMQKGNFKFTNCYGNVDPNDPTFAPLSLSISQKYITKWTGATTPKMSTKFNEIEKLRGNGNRKPGTVATFFCPRNPFEKSLYQSLPEEEYIITADFSQRFDPMTHIDIEGNKIMEPVIAFRHIFKIKDGMAFAKSFSENVESNNNYVRRTQRMVSARQGVPFQIRLSSPAPSAKGNPTNYYYMKSDTEYGRVCGYKIKVLDGNDRHELSGNQGFEFAEEFTGQGIREIDGTSYSIADGNAKYQRMLECNNPGQGHYIVQLLGLDEKGDVIYIKGSQSPLIVMEYNIIFLPEKGASMLTMEELYDSKDEYEHARVETLTDKYGESVNIDFDEYIKLNKLTDTTLKEKLISNKTKTGQVIPTNANGMDHTYFKWPVPWWQSNYAYGYDDRQGYNMYLLATHSDNTPYHAATNRWTENASGDGNGLYDIKYYRTKMLHDKNSEVPIEQGYFYYGNAATDPGVSARLKINELCQGSTIHVSAWIAEFSTDKESTNLSFNFVAVLKDNVESTLEGSRLKNGERIVLHSFITGYIPGNTYIPAENTPLPEGDMRGQWLNIYYSFVPSLAEFSSLGIQATDVDHYELELDNNAKSSAGADFGIDDIRAYVEPPLVDAQQIKPACEGESTRIRMSSPFETLLEIAGTAETLSSTNNNPDLSVYYTIIDKAQFDTKFNFYIGQNYEEGIARELAFRDALVNYTYNNGDKSQHHSYGKVTFNSKYLENPLYTSMIGIDEDHSRDEMTELLGVGYRKTKDSGERTIIFESEVDADILKPGCEYYVVLKTSPANEAGPDENTTDDEGTNTSSLWTFFDMFGSCANKNIFSLQKSVIVKLDGEIAPNQDNLFVCENQVPVIQINVWGIDNSGELIPADTNAPFDWFAGTSMEFEAISEADMMTGGDPNRKLKDAIKVFRIKHPDALSITGIEADLKDNSELTLEEQIKQEKVAPWMLNLIAWASSPSEQYPNPRLVLHKESYPVNSYSLKENETSKDIYVVAIPIACIDALKFYMVCPAPTQIKVTVCNKAPNLKHGLSYLNYPDNISDVPLRIGLDHIRTDNGSANPKEFTMKKITIPVRSATSSDGSIQSLKLVTENREIENNGETTQKVVACILLAQTDDPEYSKLIDPDLQSDVADANSLPWIGEVLHLTANTSEGAQDNLFTVQFDENFHFKEGYSYSMRFSYADGELTSQPETSEDSENGETEQTTICQGHELFTLKIVPKYLLWNGGVTDKTNLNWNNDNNWSRLDHDELYSDNDKKDGEYRHYLTDAVKDDSRKVNANTSAFAPLDFTYVVIKDNVEAPYLYAPKSIQDFTNNYNLKDKENNQLIYHWPMEPEKDDSFNYQDDPGAYKIGEPSALIKYDMAAFDFEEGKGPDHADTGCRPWYANTCKEIHFKPGGTIMNQQELIYEKAWVDVELNHSRWYTLSSPLKEVFAGDFYLPTAGARQETELYQPITFVKGTNDRFKPAVFQRGWDKSFAKVYELEKQGLDKFRNVAVKTFWSHVYNDVTEQYGGGVGFSIKTDVSKLEDPIRNNKVMFRLPKDDGFYDYYNQAGTKGHHTTITRTPNRYTLNAGSGTIKATTKTEGHYFLVGNPFMTHMDIEEFIKANESLLEPVYWVVTEKGQIAGTVSETDDTWTASASSADETDPADPTVIAPMQGFFVKAKTAAKEITLNYDESMMRRYANGNYLTETTRSEGNTSMLRISAENYGEPSSAALLVTDQTLTGMASDVEAIDNRDLDVLSTIYTVKDGQAMSINFCNEPEGVEIGVIADDDTETQLRFEGVEAVEGLSLLDKTDRSLTPLEEGMVVTVKGSAAGRFFLTYGIADEGVLSGIDFSVNGTTFTATDNAASGFLEVKVYDTMGHIVKTTASDNGTLSVQLNSGIYIVEMTTVKERKTAKIRIGR